MVIDDENLNLTGLAIIKQQLWKERGMNCTNKSTVRRVSAFQAFMDT